MVSNDPLALAVAEHALALYHKGQYQEVLRSIDTILTEALSAPLLGVAASCAYAIKRYDTAEYYWRSAIAMQKDYIDAYNDLGIALKELNRFDEAESVFTQALELDPNNADLYNNLANLFKEISALEKAEDAYKKAIILNPEYTDAYRNLGMLLKSLGRLSEAEDAYRHTLRLKPDCARTQANLGYMLLETGRYKEGWPLYETRYNLQINATFHIPSVSFPQWNGESLVGKSLLIVPEQGYGDEIQFVRYISVLKRQGVSRITLLCKSPLQRLFSTLYDADEVITSMEIAGEHDYWSFLLSIPLHVGTTLDNLPASLPYIYSPPKENTNIMPENIFRVGLVWKGSSSHENDANRSLPSLALLAPLWRVSGVAFVSLQKRDAGAEIDSFSLELPIIDMGDTIEDFADASALIEQLDLVICIDTAIAHLCGALGKSCWVLLPFIGTDWRWLRGRSDSPWYPKVMRLFRQTRPDCWDETIEDVAMALLDEVKKGRV